MNASSVSAVVLAAGKGTRMKSAKAKVLHEVFFKPMLHHVLDAVAAAGIEQTAVIVGHQREDVLASLHGYRPVPVIQEEQLGTGHAVLCAEAACAKAELVMILCGDTPLIWPQTLQAMLRQHRERNAGLTMMTTELDMPFGYGRVISDASGHVLRIVEEKDADDTERAVREINAGIYLAAGEMLFAALRQVGRSNSQGEVYLTDIVGIAVREGHCVEKFIHHPAIDVLGVNSRVELAQAHAELQLRRNRQLMLAGVTIYSPDTVLVAPESSIGQDVVLHAGVQISGHCVIGNGAVIGAHSVLHNCVVASGEQVPPLTGRILA